MIGLFDSGFGGLSTLKEFQKIMPKYDYVYFGDSLNVPYGDKPIDEILKLTESGVRFLFDNGAEIVILACNTATACTIRILQQRIFPDKKILGVTIPGAEKVHEMNLKKVGVLATLNTVRLKAYKERVHILNNKIEVQEIEAPDLVPLIEKGEINTPSFEKILSNYLDKFDSDIEGIILGCTHYSLIKDQIEKLSKKCSIDPSHESAIKFKDYLSRHLEIEKTLSKNSKRIYYTSGDVENFYNIGKMFIEDMKLREVKKI